MNAMNLNTVISDKIVNSAYLTRLANMKCNAAFSEDLPDDFDFSSTLESLINEIRECEVVEVKTQTIINLLTEIKCRFSYLWSIAQLSEQLSFSELGSYQSQFADATIDCALRTAWYSLELKKVRKHLPLAEGGVPGLFVLGLGKLGGWDLNFSSDVDLVAFFDEEILPIPDAVGKGYIANKVLQKMTQILSNDEKTDFVWRVDWRLRPEASSSLLAMNVNAAMEFYYYRALPWHRLAMMKARTVAGDISVGERFFEGIQSFIWRQNLDLRAIDEIAHIKKRINLEHPNLKHQRQDNDEINEDCSNFNVKLGNGGIREIEFIINALQLLWGGKKPQLRVTNTLEALRNLAELELLGLEDMNVLEQAYQFFRDVENHIQMLDNAHTHLVPGNIQAQKQLIGLRQTSQDEDFSDSWQQFCTHTQSLRLKIHQQFEELFQAESEAQLGPYQLPKDWESTLNDRSISIVENWSTGFTEYNVPATMAVSLEPFMHQLFSKVFEHGLQKDVDQWLANIDDFLASQSNANQYFRLLASYPELINSIVPPLQYSPHMRKLLKQSPHIVDNLVLPQKNHSLISRFQSYEKQALSIFINKDYGERLSRIRRYVNENLYEAYLDFMQGEISVKMFQLCLTRLAECTIQASLEIAKQELELDHVPLAVLGMGKLAMARMSPLSDLDLIFIFADDFDLEIAQKVVSRLQTILGMKLQEGIAYEIDTRLRPSGRSGSTTVFLSGFKEHQLQRAKTWEHIALLPSRIVAGDPKLGAEVIKIKEQVFQLQQNRDEWFSDIKEMWQMIEDQRIQEVDESIVSSKLRPGGLMQAEYLGVCVCIEQLADANFFFNNRHNIDRFNELLKIAQKTYDLKLDINSAIDFWSTVQIWERLLGLTDQSYAEMPEHLQTLMCNQLNCDSLEDFYKKSERISWWIEHAMQSYFSSGSMYDID